MPKKEVYTYLDALDKLRKYCAYQERCQQEVRDKLYSYGMNHEEVESAIVELIQENYLNEVRYAEAFVRGKYKIKRWGRNKIKQALKVKQVSDYCIKKGMKEIDPDLYYENLKYVLRVKMKTLKFKNEFERDYKLKQFLGSKGYEFDLIECAISEEINNS